jgi:hypothetical protein
VSVGPQPYARWITHAHSSRSLIVYPEHLIHQAGLWQVRGNKL